MSRKTVLITGASRGIGRGIALCFGAAGYRVAVHYHAQKEAAQAVVAEIIEAGGNAEIFQADIGNKGEATALAAAVTDTFGTVDVLINNAGVSLYGTLDTASDEDFDRIVSTNLGGMFAVTRALYPAMVRRKNGVICNISSMWGRSGASCEVLYSMTKAGVIGFTRALAAELGPSGVRVNAIAPGCIDTDMMKQFGEAERRALAAETPLGRIGTPADVANAALFLASDSAAFITGQVLGVDGGFLL